METMNTVLSAFLKLQNLFLVPLPTRAPLLIFHVTWPPPCFGALDSALACWYSGSPSSQPGTGEHGLAPPLRGAGARGTRAGFFLLALLPLFCLHSSTGAIFSGAKINERASGQL